MFSLAYASLLDYSSVAHALVYSRVYLLLIVVTRPYNYERVNLGAGILVLAALVYGVVGTYHVSLGPVPVFWSEIAVFLLSWFC